MKTKPLFLLLSLASILFLGGCQKDQVEVREPNQQSTTKTVNLIKTFAQRLHSDLKTTDSIPVDSVIWYLGAYANYTYGDASAKGLNLYIDSSFLSFSYNRALVSVNAVSIIYDNVIDSIRGHYSNVDETDKHLMSAIVELVSENSTQITFKVTSIIVFGPYSTQPYVFDSVDYWKWWNMDNNNGGYCNGTNQGTQLESDAAEEIQKKVMIRKAVPTQNYCYGPPYSTVSFLADDFLNPNHNGPYNYYLCYLYYNDDRYPYFHGCIAPFEMNFYLTGAEHVVYTANNNTTDPGARPPDMSFMALDLYGTAFCPQYYSTYMHGGYAFYGTVLPSGGIPEDL